MFSRGRWLSVQLLDRAGNTTKPIELLVGYFSAVNPERGVNVDCASVRFSLNPATATTVDFSLAELKRRFDFSVGGCHQETARRDKHHLDAIRVRLNDGRPTANSTLPDWR